MKKSTLLTVASVGAVALTSAMTFAAWDNLTATTTDTVTFDRINVTATTTIPMTVKPRTPGTLNTETVSATSEIEVDLTSVKDDGLKTNTVLKLEPSVKANEEPIPTEEYDITIEDNGETLVAVNGIYTDENITFNNNNNKYTVTITPKVKNDGSSSIIDKELTVAVKATFQEATSTSE